MPFNYHFHLSCKKANEYNATDTSTQVDGIDAIGKISIMKFELMRES